MVNGSTGVSRATSTAATPWWRMRSSTRASRGPVISATDSRPSRRAMAKQTSALSIDATREIAMPPARPNSAPATPESRFFDTGTRVSSTCSPT